MPDVPASSELREFLHRHDLTGRAAARIVGVEPRTVRKWAATEGTDNARSIPWSAWALLRLYVGELSLEDFREMVAPPRA